MFKYNQPENRLDRLKKRSFGDLNLQERPHLQEWLAQTPEALGEELLIIQKEFAGFEGTRERLDLLGLDKEGRLVVIENKLDDSGRNVVWQGLKYVAYCSSLKKREIVEIYQKYLDRCFSGESAVENLCEFLDVEDLEEVALNPGNEQRLILVAANFRKEVTSTVLWLIGNGIRSQCFRVSPYRLGEEVLIDLQQIIPTPEAADYMIGMAEKESEEKSVQGTQKSRYELRRAFWTKALEELQVNGIEFFKNRSPSERTTLGSSTAVPLPNCGYRLLMKKKEVLVDLYLGGPKDENKRIFDQLKQKKQEIEERFGAELQWLRMDGNKASRVCYSQPFDGHNRESWPTMIEWLGEHIVKLEQAFREPLDLLNQELKSQGVESVDDPQD